MRECTVLSISVDRAETDKMAKGASDEYIVRFLSTSLAVKLTFVCIEESCWEISRGRELQKIPKLRTASRSSTLIFHYKTRMSLVTF